METINRIASDLDTSLDAVNPLEGLGALTDDQTQQLVNAEVGVAKSASRLNYAQAGASLLTACAFTYFVYRYVRGQAKQNELTDMHIANERNRAKLDAALGNAAGVELEEVPAPEEEAKEVDGK